ncbi:hypothetical protein BCY84_04448 [Trypanosoma cruzi cruzi]|nr:hypothetical protein BCY84_04448 [Trypanosoma cruzi cruzi]
MKTALCASPAARMRRGRDERRAEGAVTCGSATRACGAEHTFLSLLFCCVLRSGRADTRSATHTATPCRRVFKIFLFLLCAGSPFGVGLVSISFLLICFLLLLRSLSRWSDATAVVSACFSQSPHTRVTVLCGPHSRADGRAEGSSNTQMTP